MKMTKKPFLVCASVILILAVLINSGCVWYREGSHIIKIVNHTDRYIFTGSVQFGSLMYWAGDAMAQGEGGDVFMDVRWVPRKGVFTWNWGDVIGDEDNVQEIEIPPYPELPNGVHVMSNELRIHVFPDNRIEAELAVSYYDQDDNAYAVSLYEGPKKIGWWLGQD